MAALIEFPGPWSALVTLPIPPDGAAVRSVIRLEARVLEWDPALETIPAFNRLLVTGSPMDWEPGRVQEAFERLLTSVLGEHDPDVQPQAAPVTLPACYQPELAPDLEALATGAGISVAEFGRMHAATAYTVLATGFAPGFAYLGDVDPLLAAPRRKVPRREVAAGSIGIADRRTGVYPSTGPGGWQLVGRVPESLFEDAETRLARFSPGQQVRFRPISLADYHAES